MSAMVAPVIVLGAAGMLGTDLVAAMRASGLSPQGYDLPEFDITREADLLKAVKPGSVVVNCAAYTNVEKAQSEPERAYAVNAAAVECLGRIASDRAAWVLHISTDFVFDGTLGRPYVETDVPNPLNIYGRTKLDGERQLAASGCKHCVLRVQWTYGRAGDNFVRKIANAARARAALQVVDDQVGSPTATTEVAAAIVELIVRAQRPTGLLHFAAAGHASRYAVARFIIAGLGMGTEVVPCRTCDFPSVASRPLNSRFDCTRMQRLLGRPIEAWQGPLGRFLEGL